MDKTEITYLVLLLGTVLTSILIKHLTIFGNHIHLVFSLLGFAASAWVCSIFVHVIIIFMSLILFVFPRELAGRLVQVTPFIMILPARLWGSLDGVSNAMLLVTTLRMSMFGSDLRDSNIKFENSTATSFAFLRYVYFLQGIFTGPVFPPHFLYTPESLQKQDSAQTNDSKSTIQHLLFSVLYGLIHLTLSAVCRILLPLTSTGSFFMTFCYIICFGISFRFRCYFAWSLVEVSLAPFDLVHGLWGTNIPSAFAVEITKDMRSLPEKWNSSVGNFLRIYVYDKLKGSIRNSVTRRFATFLVSAWWHGTETGIYIFFLFLALFCELDKSFRLPSLVARLHVQIQVAFLTSAFLMKNQVSEFLMLSSNVFHLSFLYPIFLFVFFYLTNKRKSL